jgi:RNA polymerase sigma-70 factor (ECF subfamily)
LQADLIGDFRRAWEARDVDSLIGLLHPAATAIPDGADLVSAALCPIEGDEEIAHYLVDLAGTAPGLTIVEGTVNGRPGLMVHEEGITAAAFAFDVECDRIIRVWAARNPSGRHPGGSPIPDVEAGTRDAPV